jgi:hypothetical protein
MRQRELNVMTAEASSFLRSFDMLPEADQREVAAAILQRSLVMDQPPLTDGELVNAAEDIFLQLDRSEQGNA